MNPDLAAMFAALSAASTASPNSSTPGGEGDFVPSPIAPVMPYDVLTLSQAAGYLQTDESVVVQEAEAGRLPGQKLGEEWRFLRLAITEWLRAGRGPKSSKEQLLAVAGSMKDIETPEEHEAFLANIQAYRDEVDRATGSGKYAPE